MSDLATYVPEFTDPDCWGTIFVNDDEDFDIRDAVDSSVEPDKRFNVSDPATIRSLDLYATTYGTLTKLPGG